MKNEEQWNARAKENAMYWVLTEKRNWIEEEFYKRGEEDILKYALPFLKKKGLLPASNECMTALDIGCGLGRLTKALQPYFKKVIGVDVSSGIIK
jgi:predicted TPR repeat methyltransferase